MSVGDESCILALREAARRISATTAGALPTWIGSAQPHLPHLHQNGVLEPSM
jgi:hypothetical protein